VYVKKEVEIFHQAVVLGNVTPGHYSIPFSFLLPASVPNSFEWVLSEYRYATTNYSLKAIATDQTCEQKLIIVQKIVENP
jgi:hypothetical protein